MTGSSNDYEILFRKNLLTEKEELVFDMEEVF